MFRPGPLTGSDAARLNELLRRVEQLDRASASAPLSTSRLGGSPQFAVPADKPIILAEITADDGGTPPVHEAKRKTRAAEAYSGVVENDVVDYSPETLYTQVLSTDGTALSPTTLVELVPIPDQRGWFWAFSPNPAVDLFPAELTSAYSSGYSWRRMTVTSGTWAVYSPSTTGANDAFSPDNDQTFPIGTRGVVLRDGDKWAFVPVARYRTHCVSGVWWRQRSLDGGATWADVESTGVSCSTVPKPSGCDPSGWAWVAGLLWIDGVSPTDPPQYADCLKLTVLSASGFCAAIDDGQELYLRTEDGVTWTSQEWDCEAGPPDWIDQDFECDPTSTAGPAVFTIDPTTGMPTLKICGVTRALTPTCGGAGVVVFTGGGAAFCDGVTPTEPCADNTFVIQLECVCCSIDGWQGPGWYCVLDAGADCETDTGDRTAVELIEADRCDDTILICSCVFATEAEALAECPAPVTVACCDTPVAAVLYAHFTGALSTLGDVTLTHDGSNWVGTVPSVCGGDFVQITFSCTSGTDPGTWTLAGEMHLDPDPITPMFTAGVAATDCSPMDWASGTQTASFTSCSGSFTATVNETP